MHPEVTTEDRPVDMVEQGYDLVSRVNPEPDESLVGRAFLRDRLVIVASPDLDRPADCRPVPAVVRGGASGGGGWVVKSPEGPSRIAYDPVLRLSSLIMLRDAVRVGVGAASLPISLVSHDVDAGRLVHSGGVDATEIALWTLYPSRRLLSARVGVRPTLRPLQRGHALSSVTLPPQEHPRPVQPPRREAKGRVAVGPHEAARRGATAVLAADQGEGRSGPAAIGTGRADRAAALRHLRPQH